MTERLLAKFHGNVQGVGFRYTTSQYAARFAVTGSVRNCSDGTVELIAEGDRKEIMSFLAAIREHFTSNLTEVEMSWSVPTGEYKAFQIRR